MVRVIHIVLFCSCFTGMFNFSFSQQAEPFFESKVSLVSYDSILNYLKKMEIIGMKTTPSAAQSDASAWLRGRYAEMGYPDIRRDSFLYSSDTVHNIVVTKTGVTDPDKTLIICGHYDTEGGPGVNDNGSGVSVILEIARILADVQTKYTVKFINFSGEEQGYIGSHHYVDGMAIPQNQDIFLTFNIDEVGGISGTTNNIIVCEKDLSYPFANNAASSAYTDTLVNLVQLYSSLQAEISNAYGSDYVPFQQAGYVITGLFEKNQSSFVHSLDDSLKNLDTSYVYETAKASVGAALYFAGAINPVQYDETIKKKNEQVMVYPNPFVNGFSITGFSGCPSCIFQLYNSSGKLIFTEKPEKLRVETEMTDNLKEGLYLYRVIDDGKMIHTGKIIK